MSADSVPSLHELAANLVQEDLDREREERLRMKIEQLEVQRRRDEEIAREEAAREAARVALVEAEKAQKAAREKAQKALSAFISAAQEMHEVADGVYHHARAAGYREARHADEAELDIASAQLKDIHRGWRVIIGMTNRTGLLTDLA